MNHDGPNITESALERALADRADGLDLDAVASPLLLDDVRRTAVTIRRRRRAVTGVGLAAAVAAIAVAVPATGLLNGPTEIEPAQHPVSPPASVLHDGVLTRPDGSTVAVPVDTRDVSYTRYGVLSDGRIVVPRGFGDGTATIQVFGSDGTVEAEYPAVVNVVTMGQGDDTVAWTGADDRIWVLEAGVAEPVALAETPRIPGGAGSIDAVYGSDCADGGCTVLVGDWRTTTTVITGPQAPRTFEASVEIRVSDISPDGSLWAVDLPPTAPNQQYGCAALYDPEQDEITARTCDTSGLVFSPDGEHLLGGRAENNMLGQAMVLDTDLVEVASFVPDADQEALSRAAWADAGHVYLARGGWDGSDWRLERAPIDGGDATVLVGPDDGPNPEISTAFAFSD